MYICSYGVYMHAMQANWEYSTVTVRGHAEMGEVRGYRQATVRKQASEREREV